MKRYTRRGKKSRWMRKAYIVIPNSPKYNSIRYMMDDPNSDTYINVDTRDLWIVSNKKVYKLVSIYEHKTWSIKKAF